jgi:glycosyltransferase involved in cell wall biosynthesis
MQFYRNNPVDVFVNVSQTEGTSVAVMEAISCGIPVVATAVGGNPEIVTEKNGLLLSPNPSATEIANALFLFLDNPSSAVSKRIGSRAVWNERYNSERNFPDFISRLKEIRELSSRHQMN